MHYPNPTDDWATVCRWIDENNPKLAAALAAADPVLALDENTATVFC